VLENSPLECETAGIYTAGDVKADQKLLTICCSHLAPSANRHTHTHTLQSAVVLGMHACLNKMNCY